MSAARAAATIGALVGVFGLVLQYVLLFNSMTAEGASALAVTWRYFVYFTLLTNTFVTLVMVRAALRPTDLTGLNAPRVELMAVTSILFVGIVYNLLLASRWDPQGWQKVADVIVHNAVPVLFLVFWLLRPHGALKWRDAGFAALWPAAYAVYGLTRGAFDGFYPYFFLDPTALSVSAIALNLVGLVLAFLVGALALIAGSRILGRSATSRA
ncbi:Pr6Pr family membrane protein [Terricaulis sp.]|jgi:xanthosine utilization system XapX-like protein|uniref:Pr6Pr family membrane protein n=1 Tax=Terricaulis sp. TaxID=2768686 RepID=UPI002AC3CD27|nr:Pr6Pr family membrane protein [Terricaulis sp.]MDZ4690811.1 Pr6Pr family membrane protein [Terricaulis sp.]